VELLLENYQGKNDEKKWNLISFPFLLLRYILMKWDDEFQSYKWKNIKSFRNSQAIWITILCNNFIFNSCVAEYIDIYAEVQSPDPAELINSPFAGRYCGPIPPRRRISLYRAIALSFYTEKFEVTPDLFEGRYSFINECKFNLYSMTLLSLLKSYTHFFYIQLNTMLVNLFKGRRVPI
jgi:hypothetical protein